MTEHYICERCGKKHRRAITDRLCAKCRWRAKNRDRIPKNIALKITGFVRDPAIPEEEYNFTLGAVVDRLLLEKDLEAGNIPPGYILESGRARYQTIGVYGKAIGLKEIR